MRLVSPGIRGKPDWASAGLGLKQAIWRVGPVLKRRSFARGCSGVSWRHAVVRRRIDVGPFQRLSQQPGSDGCWCDAHVDEGHRLRRRSSARWTAMAMPHDLNLKSGATKSTTDLTPAVLALTADQTSSRLQYVVLGSCRGIERAWRSVKPCAIPSRTRCWMPLLI